MKRLILYDPVTGAIAGRVTCDDSQAGHYLNHIEADEATFNDRPEFWAKVDNERKLAALTEAEARAKGAPEDFIARKIAEGKLKTP